MDMSTVTTLPLPPATVAEAEDADGLMGVAVDPPDSTITSVAPIVITTATVSTGRIRARSVSSLLIEEYYGASSASGHCSGSMAVSADDRLVRRSLEVRGRAAADPHIHILAAHDARLASG